MKDLRQQQQQQQIIADNYFLSKDNTKSTTVM